MLEKVRKVQDLRYSGFSRKQGLYQLWVIAKHWQ